MTPNINHTKLKHVHNQKIKRANLQLKKDLLIEDLSVRAENLQAQLKTFKEYCFEKIENYMEDLSIHYDMQFSKKGNLNLTNTEGEYRVTKNSQEYIVLDENLRVAKALIDKCLNKWCQGGSVELQKVVNLAFSVDKRGKLNIPRVLSLRKLDIEDLDWERAMQAISDSIDTINSKQFIRIYKKDDKNTWHNISLDIAKM